MYFFDDLINKIIYSQKKKGINASSFTKNIWIRGLNTLELHSKNVVQKSFMQLTINFLTSLHAQKKNI